MEDATERQMFNLKISFSTYSPVSSVRSVRVTFLSPGKGGKRKCLDPLTLMFTSSLEAKGQGSSSDIMPIINLFLEST